MQSNLYYDIDASVAVYSDLIKRVEKYAVKKNGNIYVPRA